MAEFAPELQTDLNQDKFGSYYSRNTDYLKCISSFHHLELILVNSPWYWKLFPWLGPRTHWEYIPCSVLTVSIVVFIFHFLVLWVHFSVLEGLALHISFFVSFNHKHYRVTAALSKRSVTAHKGPATPSTTCNRLKMFTIFLVSPTVNYIDVLFHELHKDVLNF